MKQESKTGRKLALLVYVVVDCFVCKGKKTLELDQTIFIYFLLSPIHTLDDTARCTSQQSRPFRRLRRCKSTTDSM